MILLLCLHYQSQYSCLIQNKNRTDHKQMRQECADDHAVGSQQESNVESKPADKSGVACH